MNETENIHNAAVPNVPAVDVDVEQTPHRARIDALKQGKGIVQKYRIIDASIVQKYWPNKAVGVPVFDPPICMTTLFSPLAMLIGPLYYFFMGMWRKGLSSIAVLGAFFVVGMQFSIDGKALEYCIIEEYATQYVFLTSASFVMILSLCKGYRVFALFLGLSMSAFVFITHTQVVDLHIGVSTAFMWMVGGIMGLTLMVLSYFYFLGRKWLMFVICSSHLIIFFMAGVPFSFQWYYTPTSCLLLLLGTQGVWDRYRHSVLGERFWW